MKIAIMQPYFMPYIGYYQLIAAADIFILYDNIKYTKKGWINRNRLLQNGNDKFFTIPLKKDHDHTHVYKREIADTFNRNKLLNQLKEAYSRSPYYRQTLPLLEEIIQYENPNLFDYLHHSIVKTCSHFGITTKIQKSSEIAIDHNLTSQDKVLALCKKLNAKTYINPVGGIALYSKEIFSKFNIDLKFIQPTPFTYPQFENIFIPWLSIIDVMMFNSTEKIQDSILNRHQFI